MQQKKDVSKRTRCTKEKKMRQREKKMREMKKVASKKKLWTK